MPIIKQEEVSGVGSRPVIKRGECVWRIIGVEQKQSKTGNEMLVLKQELCLPTTVKGPPKQNPDGSVTEGEDIEVAGSESTDWITLSEGNTRSVGKLRQLLAAVEHPNGSDVTDTASAIKFIQVPENIMFLRGKAIRTRTHTEGGPVTDENTGKPVLDGAGNPVIDNNYRIDNYFNEVKEYTVAGDSIPF